MASLATFIADVLIHREDSTFAKRVDAYEAGGATRYVAVARAALDTIDDILYDTTAGGMSGWAHAAMAKAWDAVTNVLDGEDAAHRTEAGVTQVQTEQPTLTYSPSIGQALTDGVVRGARVLSDPQASIPIETLTDGAVLGAEMLQERSPQTSAASQTDASSVNTDTRTNRQDTVWTEDADVATDAEPVPVRYADALREYLGKGTEQNAMLDAAPDADKASLQETAPKPEEQLISELVPKISKPGITPGRATIEAQRLYTDAERLFGPNADTVLETFEAGQEPRKFFDGIKTAYLSGKIGSRAALENSGAAAYLTEAQRELSFVLGAGNKPAGGSIPADTLSADIRDRLEAVTIRGTTKLPQGFSAFPEGDALNERIKKVRPDGNKFDVAMHGSPTAVAFGGNEANMSPHLLAQIIRHSEGYHGQDVRLLSCSTGSSVDGAYCFAEELANALGVTVWAPNDLLMVNKDGIFYIGLDGSGQMVSFSPNERGRIK